MKKKFAGLALFFGVLYAVDVGASVIGGPGLWITVTDSDGSQWETPVPFVADDGTDRSWIGGEQGWTWEQPGAFSMTVSGLMDPDPEISYAFSVFDFGAPSTFAFAFSQGIVPTPAPGVASHTYSGSTTDGGNGALTVTALAPIAGIPVDSDGITEISVYNLSQDAGVTKLNADLDLSPTFVASVFPSDTQPPFNPPAIAGPAAAGFYNHMQVNVRFGLSGGGDIYTANGRATIVPEPASASLLGLALLGVAAATRRRS